MASIQVTGLSHVFATGESSGRPVVALNNVSFAVPAGEVCALVGPSGCGKSTLLRAVSGLLRPETGSVAVDGALVTGPSEAAAVVFQDYSRSLLPWLTVEQNVELVTSRAGSKGWRTAASRESSDFLEAVGLGGARKRYPWQLSGGMQQRVAIARALAIQPKVLLLDEPFGSLDALTKLALEDLVLGAVRRFSLTVLLITHDIDEAVYMSDRVLVMANGGRLASSDGMPIRLGKPRQQIATRSDPAFGQLRGRLIEQLGGIRAAS